MANSPARGQRVGSPAGAIDEHVGDSGSQAQHALAGELQVVRESTFEPVDVDAQLSSTR